MLRIGIVGLPNVGKSTLFNAITKNQVEAANYPFTTINPNVGTVHVNDQRLYDLAKVYHPKRVLPTIVEFIDIAGLVKDASKGEGLGNQFLSHIRNVDAIFHVIRGFHDANITHVSGEVNPLNDLETIETELLLSDLEQIDRRISRLERQVKANLKEAKTEAELMIRLKNYIEENNTLKQISLSDDDKSILKNFNLLSLKPVIYVLNLSDTDLESYETNSYYISLSENAKQNNIEVIPISSTLEYDISLLNVDEQLEFLNSYGLKESGLNYAIQKGYELLGLETFFTAGENEVRAWTYKKGSNAKTCAGVIHSDFERGFIKAEVISFNDIMHYMSPLKVKEAGKLRIEGRDYIVKDGDVILFRFNV